MDTIFCMQALIFSDANVYGFSTFKQRAKNCLSQKKQRRSEGARFASGFQIGELGIDAHEVCPGLGSIRHACLEPGAEGAFVVHDKVADP